MHKISRLLPLILILALLCACTDNGASLKDASPTASEVVSASPEETEKTAAPSEAPASTLPAAIDNTARCRVFRTFLSDNYEALSDAFTGGISGIGFLDLDCDGGIEMVMFDSGASAALGAEIFDIVDGKVQCVSSNLDAVGRAFGGAHLSDVIVNANRFDDFRLMESADKTKRFFIVQSGNGALDFKYTELVKFGRDENDVLTLESLLYQYQDTDDDGNVTGENYKVAGKSATKADYDAAAKAFSKSAADVKYTAKGVFIWDSGADYETSSAGLQQMAEKAYALWEATESGDAVNGAG